MVPSEQRTLSSTARELLVAARTVVERSGYAGLTLEAVAAEANRRKSAIHYHFGGKPGLLVALTDWILYDSVMDLRTTVLSLPAGEARVHALVEHLLRIVSDGSSYVLFFELLPHLLADREMRWQLAGLYADYRASLGRALMDSAAGSQQPDASTLATLINACTDGVAIQLLADPKSIDLNELRREWECAISAILVQLQSRGDQELRAVDDDAGFDTE